MISLVFSKPTTYQTISQFHALVTSYFFNLKYPVSSLQVSTHTYRSNSNSTALEVFINFSGKLAADFWDYIYFIVPKPFSTLYCNLSVYICLFLPPERNFPDGKGYLFESTVLNTVSEQYCISASKVTLQIIKISKGHE